MASKKVAREAKYKPDMCDEAYHLMAERGFSLNQVAAALKISRAQATRWSKDIRKPDFVMAIEKGNEAAEAYHELKLQELASGVIKGNVVAQMYYMRVRFKGKWQQDGTNNSKVEIEHKYSGMTPDQLQNYVKTRLALTKEMGILIEGKCTRVKGSD